MTAAARRLQSLASLLAHVRERLGVDIGFVLWDGSTVPADLAARDVLAIADEGAVAALIRRPKLDTLFNLLVSARLELRNGTLFDLMPHAALEIRKVLHKTLALGTRGAVPVRVARRTVAARRSAWRPDRPRRQRDDQQSRISNTTTICRTRSTRSFSIPRWSTAARISPSRTTTSRGRSATSST